MGDLTPRELAETEEVAEVFGLPPGDEFFREFRHLHKPDVPDTGIALNLVPPRDSRERHIKNHRPPRRFAMAASKRKGHHPAHVMTDDVGAFQLERLRKLVHVLRHVGRIIATRRRSRTAHAAQIHCNHRESLCQPRHDRAVLRPILWEPMD